MMQDQLRAALKLFCPLALALVAPSAVTAQGQPGTPGNWAWIWASDQARAPDTLYFRQRFTLPKAPRSARLQITADDAFRVFFNGGTRPAATGNDWSVVQTFEVGTALRAGENVLAIEVSNLAGPGGLLYRLTAQLPDGKTLVFVSNARVHYNRRVPPVWTTPALDDRLWPRAVVVAPVNGGPWGRLRSAPTPDPARIVSLWNIRAGNEDADPYRRARNTGERMILSASASSVSDLQIMAGAGFTLFQTDSDHLSTAETAPGKWDFREPALTQQTVERLGLDWCYFPHFAFPPPWYRQTVPFTRLQCLEHQEPVQAFSLWDPRWPQFIQEGYAALAQKFGDKPGAEASLQPKIEKRKSKIATLYVGVHGDFGEAGYMAGTRVSGDIPAQKSDWEARFGNLHNHLGWWCHDPLARADFRDAMLKKYGSLENLNAAWVRAFPSEAEITYPAAPRAEARREWLDYVEWYQGVVNRACEWNLGAARNQFPETLLLLPVGFPDEDLRGGHDNGFLPKLAGRFQAGIRSTHAGSRPFAENAATMLGRLGSSSRFYGVPFWTEGPTGLTAAQTVERIFESVSQGAAGHFDWASNVVANRDVYYRYGKYLRIEKPVVDVAMFYPAAAQRLRPQQGYAPLFAQACAFLRDAANFDIVDDGMVQDGCLSRYRVLALWEGTMAEKETLEKIRAWVNDGGVLVAYDFGKVTDFNGDTSWFTEMFGYVQQVAPARIVERYVGNIPARYRLEVGQPEAADYLGEGWLPPKTEGGAALRWTGADATLRLPVNPEKQYTLVIRAILPTEAGIRPRSVLLNNREIGRMDSTGDVTYRFPITEGLLGGNTLATLRFRCETFQKENPMGLAERGPLGVRIKSIMLIERGSPEEKEAPPPTGTIQRVFDLRRLNDDWTRRYGKGLTIYYPATRQLRRGYIEVLRRVIYHLGEIDPGRRSALPVDEEFDGVYATLFTDKILYYNSTNAPVTRQVKIAPEAFAEWRETVAVPTETTWKLTLEPHSIGAIYFTPPPQELIFECEQFLELGGSKPTASPDCSPGNGMTSVRIGQGNAITTRFQIDLPGRYALYTRCIRNGRPEPVDILLNGQPLPPENRLAGQTLFQGTLSLTRGVHSLTLRARPGRDVRADFIVLTNDPTVSGYGFAVKTAPIE